jgi:beta-glucanase (GH16 family)
LNNGYLTITAKKEQYVTPYWTYGYTSARLNSTSNFQYGVFEMRAQLPKGRGTWPAFWLLAATNPLNWPADGEIDVLESVGYENSIGHGTIHCMNNNGYSDIVSVGTSGNDAYQGFHLYQVRWSSSSIYMYVDGQYYFNYTKPSSSYADWPFDNQFKIILNFAVGGDWGKI